MVQQVWTYDGEPYLIWNERDLPEQYTVIPPEDGMYYPIRFDEDENKWIGSEPSETPSEEEEEETEQHIPSANEIMLAQAQMQVTKTTNQLVKSQKEQAETLKELTKKEKRMQQLEEQQAQTMLEITKMKASN